jgi:hypothetical protein
MSTELYERVRRNLFGDHHQNALVQILKDRSVIGGPIQGTPEEFSQIVYELSQGELNKRNETVSYEAIAKGNKNTLKFRYGSLFRVVKVKGQISGALIVVTPHLPPMDDLLEAWEAPLARLVSDVLMIRDSYKRVVDEYRREELKLAADKAAAEMRMARKSRL